MTISHGADDAKETEKEPSSESSDTTLMQKLYNTLKGCLKKIFGIYGVADGDEKNGEDTDYDKKDKKKKKGVAKSEAEEGSSIPSDSPPEK